MALFKDRLKALRAANNLTQLELADKLNLSKSAISMYERGERRPEPETLEALCDFFNVDTDYILGRKDTTTLIPQSNFAPSMRPIRVNVLGRVPAGIPIEAIEDIVDWEELDPRVFNPDHEYFGLMIRGDSVYPKYMEGDTIICQRADDAESGRDVVAYIDGYDALVKQLVKYDNGNIELRPLNTAYPPRVFTPSQAASEPVKILGFVRELRRKI